MEKSEEQGLLRDCPASVLPEELIVWEILVRLPAKDILRYRTVCRAWRRHTSAAAFLLAHHRHQPSLLLFEYDDTNGAAAFDAVDLRRRPSERQPVLRINNDHQSRYGNRSFFPLHASCDGLVLLCISDVYYLCNPATRQWISLPKLRGARVAGLYSHSPTGEYRILYFCPSVPAVYYVLTLGSSAPAEEPRCIGRPIASPSVRYFVEQGLMSQYNMKVPPILVYDRLYWIRLSRHPKKGLVFFDTISESFRSMQLPTGAGQLADSGLSSWHLHEIDRLSSWHLLEIDGTLGISWGSGHERMMKLWVLQDYETEAWSLRYQVDYSVLETTRTVQNNLFRRAVQEALFPRGDGGFMVMSVSEDGDTLIRFTPFQLFHPDKKGTLFHVDKKGKLLQSFDEDLLPTRFRFKESLFRHAFLEGPSEGKGGPSEGPQFFVGL